MRNKIELSILYVYYNTPSEIQNSIASIKQGYNGIYEIVIVDNASLKKLPKKLTKNRTITIIHNNKNVGYGNAMNQAADVAKGEYLLVVNTDTVFQKASITKLLIKLKKEKKIGIIGPKMLDNNNKIVATISGYSFLPQSIVVYSPITKLFPNNSISKKFWLKDLDRNKEQNVDVISGACMLMRKVLFQKIHGFDKRFFMYFEESDLCFQVKKLGYKIVYYPDAVITHFVGRSSRDKKKIQREFEKSRFLFFKKYHGLLPAVISEGILRISSFTALSIIFLGVLSLFLNLYKINSLMMFIGDFGRDYLAARDMLITGHIPLLGIPSSVRWLHQGPFSIYIIATAFFLGNYHPVAPALLYALIGVCSTILVYIIGKTLFNQTTGLLAGLFYATSPLIIVNARMPYHTTAIPFFACIFFLLLYKIIHGKTKLLPLLFLISGVLFLLELSNAVLFLILLLYFLLIKPKVQIKVFVQSILGFLLGISPFILYDLTHHFVQTGGFILWALNRTRLFLGLTSSGNATTHNVAKAISTIWQQFSSIIFPASQIIVTVILLGIICLLWIKKREILNKKSNIFLLFLWLIVPLSGYIIHTSPGTAYFPLLFPAIALLIGWTAYLLIQKNKYFLLLFLCFCIFNAGFLISNEYFLTTKNSVHSIPPGDYNIGTSWVIQDDVAKNIVRDADNKAFSIQGGGFLKTLENSTDTYIYLSWWRGGKLNDKARMIYRIYPTKKSIPKGEKLIFQNTYNFVTRNEK